MLHLDAATIRRLCAAEIIALNTYNNIPDRDNIEIIATLLFEEADVIERSGGTNALSFQYYRKSFELFLFLFNETNTEKFAKNTGEAIQKLENYETDNETEYRIYRYYLKKELYGKAEDALYRLLNNDYPDIKNEIKVFYGELLKKGDDNLEKGNLPRDEIIEGMKELET